jgi:transcription factor TGA
MGIYERQRHLVPTGVWGEPFRLDADAVAMPLPLPLAAFPSVTVATPAPLDVVEPEAEEIKLGKRLVLPLGVRVPQYDPPRIPMAPGNNHSAWFQLQAQQDDVPRMQEAPPSSDSFSHDDDDARPRDKVRA